MSKGNMKVAGNGTIAAGEYEEVKIMGNATSEGEIKAEMIKVMGSARFGGNIETKECTVNGDAMLEGNIIAQRLKVNGNLFIKGDCQVEELSVNGKTEINGVVECNNVVIKGDLQLTEACQTKSIKVCGGVTTQSDLFGEEITIDGRINCKGLLSGENICLHAFADSFCQEIGATKLVVEKPFYHLFWFGYGKKNGLTCNLIEADEINLEFTKAKIVRGKNVILNKQCEIDTVEYSNQYTKGDDCRIREVTKVD